MSTTISSFNGKYTFLSNFFYQPKELIEYEGLSYPSAEHAFQAAKIMDLAQREVIAAAKTPREAKKLGRRCRLRADWEDVKEAVMEDILRAKFSHQRLREKLLETRGYLLIEGNTWGDYEWGCVWNRETREWEGQNKLGQLLMLIRLEFETDESMAV